MMPAHLRPILRQLTAELHARFGARFRELRLFGSYARGEADEDSDVDVLVLVDELDCSEIAIVSDIATRISIESGAPIAALPFATQQFERMRAAAAGLAREIERDGERP